MLAPELVPVKMLSCAESSSGVAQQRRGDGEREKRNAEGAAELAAGRGVAFHSSMVDVREECLVVVCIKAAREDQSST